MATGLCGLVISVMSAIGAVMMMGVMVSCFPLYSCYNLEREHENCGPQPGCVRAHLESGGYNISPLKPRNGRPRTQVQHLVQIDLKGWGACYLLAFQQHCLLQMMNSVAGFREWFSQTDERGVPTRIPVMVNMASSSLSLSKSGRSLHQSAFSLDQTNSVHRNSVLMDEDSNDDDEFQIAESEQEV